MKSALILLLLLASFGLWGLESSHRFALYGDLEEEQQRLGTLWAMDISESLDLQALSLQGEYSMYARYQSSWEDGHNATMNAESYRAWVSLSRPQTELRIGLQRLNFGSARILRPLQWFDTLDPLDPHQYTSGVEAALLRHHWLNNANLWVWVIRGTEQRSMSTGEDRIADVSSAQATKSLPFTELRSVSTRDVSNPRGNPDPGKNFSSKEDSPELGGRVQYPSPLGDLAISYHHRELEQGAEDRAGLDLRMDHTIGSWIEASVSAFRDAPLLPDYVLSLTLGADCTFSIGNGLAITAEQMMISSGGHDNKHIEKLPAALMLSYPLGLLDSVSAIGSIEYKEGDYALGVIWQRVYDIISWELTVGTSSLTSSSLRAMINAHL